MQVTLSTGRQMDIAPLTKHQVKQVLAVNDLVGKATTWAEGIAVLEARMNVCHQAMCNTGRQAAMEEVEELTVQEVDELFYAVCDLTLQCGELSDRWKEHPNYVM